MKKHYFLLLLFVLTTQTIFAQIVNIPDANFKNALINNTTVDTTGDGIANSDADFNNDGEVQQSEADAIFGIFVLNYGITSMEGIASFPNITELRCNTNQLTSLDVSANTNLVELRCSFNSIESLDVSSNPNLELLFCSSNGMNSLNVSANPNLKNLSCFNNNYTSLDISSCTLLEKINCNYNQLTTFDISQNQNLEEVYCDNNSITTIDISSNQNLFNFHCSDNEITHIFMKNGVLFPSTFGFDFSGNPNVSYICADENEFDRIETKLNQYNLMNVSVNSYCTFTPGGEFYTIEGNVKLDLDTNGCDINDGNFPNLSFVINDGSNTASFIANTSGNYTIPVEAGNYTITPQLENSSYFTVAPTSISVNFPSDTSPNIQDFCIIPNGTHNDLEVNIIPLEQARPGFDTNYKIVYKNKGNTLLSGSVSLTFNDNYMDVVTANPVADTQNSGSLAWNYTNLAPFETRSILYTMNLNTPTDASFPLNGDDELTYVASIAPEMSDETPDDNIMTFVQTVVNSFDPNDKTCLEGDRILEDKVGDYVHYLIRFENTGTASAINVVVKDDIDPVSYEIATLQVLDSSHDYTTRIDGQEVEFVFENINLPFNDATNDGYILFKIKTKSTLMLNDTFTNKAEIYFDFNAPIITNDETTQVSEPLSRNDVTADTTVKVYPKPTNDILYIQGEYSIKTVDLYSIQGSLVHSITITGNQKDTKIFTKTLSKGLYILKATSNKGVFIDKIIKQ